MDDPPLVPPLIRRVAFWALNWRLPPAYRSWVARQLQRPDFQRRRQAALLTFIVLFVLGPQLLPAGHNHGLYLLVLMLYLVTIVAAMIVAKPLTETQRTQMLAYHGVTAAGQVAPPDARWTGIGSPRLLAALLASTMVVAGAGVAVASARSSHRQCTAARPADLTPILPLLDKPVTAAVFIPAQFQNVHLRAPRMIGTGTLGIRFLAADVVGDRGAWLGTAAWRVIDRDNAYHWPAGVDSLNALAAEITPTTGYVTTGHDGHVDPLPECLHAG